LPGSSAIDFFAAWLATGAGGTCWAGNGALHDLLVTLGYDASRVAATMLVTPDTPPSNHGSVIVRLDGERYIVDASILTGVPLRIPESGEPPEPAATVFPRVERHGDTVLIMWRTPNVPSGFPCRLDRIGVDHMDWDALHQRTAVWSPFNYAVNARVNRGATAIGISAGQRFEFDAGGQYRVEAHDRAGRDRFLLDELGLDPGLVARIPDDRPMPPPPPGFPARPDAPSAIR
jgi:hypothetical protein